jgi:NADPH2:quinone reductase
MISRADLASSEDLIIFGATGGVGHADIQIVSHAGATVYACPSSSNKGSDSVN